MTPEQKEHIMEDILNEFESKKPKFDWFLLGLTIACILGFLYGVFIA
jgi:hypothetical protein